MPVCVRARLCVIARHTHAPTHCSLPFSLSLSLWSIAHSRPPSCATIMCVCPPPPRVLLSSCKTRSSASPPLCPSFPSPPPSVPLSLSAGAGGAATSPERIRSLMSKSHSTQQCHTLPVVVEGGKDVGTLKKKKNAFSPPLSPSRYWHCSKLTM